MSYAAILAYTDGHEASAQRLRIAAELALSMLRLSALAPARSGPPVSSPDLIPREIEFEIAAAAKELAETEKKVPDRHVGPRPESRMARVAQAAK